MIAAITKLGNRMGPARRLRKTIRPWNTLQRRWMWEMHPMRWLCNWSNARSCVPIGISCNLARRIDRSCYTVSFTPQVANWNLHPVFFGRFRVKINGVFPVTMGTAPHKSSLRPQKFSIWLALQPVPTLLLSQWVVTRMTTSIRRSTKMTSMSIATWSWTKQQHRKSGGWPIAWAVCCKRRNGVGRELHKVVDGSTMKFTVLSHTSCYFGANSEWIQSQERLQPEGFGVQDRKFSVHRCP